MNSFYTTPLQWYCTSKRHVFWSVIKICKYSLSPFKNILMLRDTHAVFHFLSNAPVMTQRILTRPARVEWFWVNDFRSKEYHIWYLLFGAVYWSLGRRNSIPYFVVYFVSKTKWLWRNLSLTWIILQIRYHGHVICVFTISRKPISQRNDLYLARFCQLLDEDNHSYLSHKLGDKIPRILPSIT